LIRTNIAPVNVSGINRMNPFLMALTWGCLPIFTAKGSMTFSNEAINVFTADPFIG
jgi:hypothetical protein